MYAYQGHVYQTEGSMYIETPVWYTWPCGRYYNNIAVRKGQLLPYTYYNGALLITCSLFVLNYKLTIS